MLARLRGRLRLQLVLELAADAAIVLSATAAILVFLDWWFRFGVPVRIVLLVLELGRRIDLSGHPGGPPPGRCRGSTSSSLAMTLDRYRPGTGQQIADVLQLPDLLGESGFVGLAGDGAAGRPAGLRRAGRVGLAARSGTASGRPSRSGPWFSALLVPRVFALMAPGPPG